MSKFLEKESSDTLYRAIVSLQDVDECRRFFQDVSVHPLLCAALRLDPVESGLHFVFVHASSPPNVSFSFARASRSWFRTVDGGLQSIAAISSVW